MSLDCGRSRSTHRDPTQTGEHADSTQKGPSQMVDSLWYSYPPVNEFPVMLHDLLHYIETIVLHTLCQLHF